MDDKCPVLSSIFQASFPWPMLEQTPTALSFSFAQQKQLGKYLGV
jgi:hypothetical protein